MFNAHQYTEVVPFSTAGYPRIKLRDLPEDFRQLRKFYHEQNPQCLPLTSCSLYCKPGCSAAAESKSLAQVRVYDNEWKEFQFRCSNKKCRAVHPRVPNIFAGIRVRFRDLSDSLYLLINKTSLTSIHETTHVGKFQLYELKKKFEATLSDAQRLVAKFPIINFLKIYFFV